MNGQHLTDRGNLSKGDLAVDEERKFEKRTESLIIAAQDQALRTIYRKARIEKSTNVSTCRLCKDKEETVSHIVSECSKIA